MTAEVATDMRGVRSSGLIARGKRVKGDRSSCSDFFIAENIREEGCEGIDFVGLFDGHSGGEAAEYARDHLFKAMMENKDIYSSDSAIVSRAMKTTFIKVHEDMWSARGMPSYSV